MFFLFSAGCQDDEEEQCSDFSLAISNISDEEEYQIIAAIVEEYYSNADFFHIAQESQSNSDSSILARYFDFDEVDFESSTIEAYIQLNASPFIWGERFEKHLTLISKEEIDCLFESNANGWNAYYSKYENSETILKFGRPIQEGNRAIITYENLCGWLCSSGYTVTLQKINNEWTIENYYLIWIS